MNIHVGDVSHIIQLAIAPVFLLSGIGPHLIVLTNRLARIIDRSRDLEDRLRVPGGSDQSVFCEELEILFRRAHLINRAITLSASCALLVCLVVAALFIGDALGLELDRIIAGFFVLAMLSLIGSFSFLLREIFIATRTLSMGYVFKSRQ
jgi:hypothetical protein